MMFISCTPLRRSQVKLVGNYFNTLADYPSNIRTLNERAAKLTLESDNLRSALYPSDSLRVVSLVNAVNQYEELLNFPDSVATELAYLEKYIGGYYILIPNGFNIYRALKSTSESIIGLFGFRSVASTVIPDKDVEITRVKKKKIQNHVTKESKQFRSSLSKVKIYIDQYLIPSLEQADAKVKQDFQVLFQSDNTNVSSVQHYFRYNDHFIQYFQRLILTRRLAYSLSSSIQRIYDTEGEVKKLIAERQKIEKDSYMLHHLADDLQRIRTLLGQSQ